MDWIVTTGATVEAAVDTALDELSVTQEDIEFDMGAIACEYSEYKNTDDATALDQLNKDYGLEYETLEALQADALILPYTKSYSPVNTEGSMGSPQEYDGFVVHDVEVGGWYTHG